MTNERNDQLMALGKKYNMVVKDEESIVRNKDARKIEICIRDENNVTHYEIKEFGEDETFVFHK